MATIRLLIIDDHPIFLQGLHHLLDNTPDIIVIGEAISEGEAVVAVQHLQPTVVLLDLVMPDQQKMTTIQQIAAHVPAPGVIALAAHRDATHVLQALKAGVRGYVLRTTVPAGLINAVRTVACGGALIDPEVMPDVLREFQRCWIPVDSSANKSTSIISSTDLTAREVQILARIAQGWSNKQIATELGFADKTIRNILTAIFQKLGLVGRAHAAAYAVEHGLVAPAIFVSLPAAQLQQSSTPTEDGSILW